MIADETTPGGRSAEVAAVAHRSYYDALGVQSAALALGHGSYLAIFVKGVNQ